MNDGTRLPTEPTGRQAAVARATAPVKPLFLTPFAPSYAEDITSWVRDERELTWLAPGTVPPLTPEKVVAWGKDRDRRLLLWQPGADEPIGYAELNKMPVYAAQMWIGHFVLDPRRRGRSLGHCFAAALLASAFLECAATEVLLVVFPDNRSAIRCYERSGFQVAGQETKFFKTTQREHLFLRMSITATRFYQMAAAGRLPGKPLAVHPSP